MKILTKEIEKVNSISETTKAENENMRTDITNKAYTITRCIEAVRYTRDQMRTIKGRNEKIKKRKNPGNQGCRCSARSEYNQQRGQTMTM